MPKYIQFAFPDPIFVRMVRALSLYFGYHPTILAPDGITQIPNPQTRTDFVMQSMRIWMLDTARIQEINDSVSPVQQTAGQQVQAARDAATLTAATLDVTVTTDGGAIQILKA